MLPFILAQLYIQYIILSTFIELPFVFKTFVLSIFEWPLMTGFTVYRHDYRFYLVEFYSQTNHVIGTL